uniref:Uncharacterized protein n=1 Tax=Anguilla anguilla TaxID=7936 RepID=A0A0E9XZA4_ANGAN
MPRGGMGTISSLYRSLCDRRDRSKV